jgi:hypothetical protein
MSGNMDQGPRGETGDTGATGGAGLTGATGARGARGHDGLAGQAGRDGVQGVDGHDGAGYTTEQISHVLKQLRLLLLSFAVAAAVILGYLYETGRHDRSQSHQAQALIVKSQREGCRIGASIYVHYVNQSRAQITGDLAVAADPRQPPRTRTARHRQATIEAQNVRFFDGIIDASFARQFDSPIDQRAVAGNGVSCAKVYPNP